MIDINISELRVQRRKACAVLCTVFDDNGVSIEGAVITAQLSYFDIDRGYISPILTEVRTDANGEATLALWPNQLGATSSYYRVKIYTPIGKTLTLNVTVPDKESARLEEIALLPPYPGKPDGFLIVDECLAAAARAESSARQSGVFAINSAESAELAKKYAEAGRSVATLLAFGRVLKPKDLPPNGFLKANADGPGSPPFDIQFLKGQGMIYSLADPSDPLHNHLFSYTGTDVFPTGWADLGYLGGPKGDKGDRGDDGRSVTVLLPFGAITSPANLPPDGLIPKDFDGPGCPEQPLQLKVGEGLIYNRCPPATSGYNEVWAFVGAATSPSAWLNFGVVRGRDGDPGPQGPQGPDGPQGKQGPPGQTAKLVGYFKNRDPSELPTTGFIPKDFDGPGNPATDEQLKPGDALVYTGGLKTDENYGHVWSFVGTEYTPAGWVDCGDIEGPEGPQGKEGDPGPAGPQGERGPAGNTATLVGYFKNRKPSELPANGFIPKDFDGPGNPATDEQLRVGDALIYTGGLKTDETYGHVWSYVGTEFTASGWVDCGDIEGPEGPQGPQGRTGDPGPANNLSVGNVTSGPEPKVTVTGAAPNQVLNFVLQQGPKGDKGDKGDPGGTYELPTATVNRLGGIKVGQNLTIAADGTLSAQGGGGGGVTKFNGRVGDVTLTFNDVIGGLGYTPYNKTNPDGYVTLTTVQQQGYAKTNLAQTWSALQKFGAGVEVTSGGFRVTGDASVTGSLNGKNAAFTAEVTANGFKSPTFNFAATTSWYFDGNQVMGFVKNVNVFSMRTNEFISVIGNATKPGGGQWGSFSDKRLKTNVGNLSGGLQLINKLIPVEYDWLVNPNPESEEAPPQRVGFIAQQVAEVLPTAVYEHELDEKEKEKYAPYIDENGKLFCVGFGNDFNAYLVSAIQELQRRYDPVLAAVGSLTDTARQIQSEMREVGDGQLSASAANDALGRLVSVLASIDVADLSGDSK